MGVLRVARHNSWGKYYLKGEQAEPNQNNNKHLKKERKKQTNKNTQSNNKLRSTKFREGSQEGFGEGVGASDVNPWFNVATDSAEFKRTAVERPMDLFIYLFINEQLKITYDLGKLPHFLGLQFQNWKKKSVIIINSKVPSSSTSWFLRSFYDGFVISFLKSTFPF